MSSTIESNVARRKDHKGAKVMSLGIIWAAIGLVAILVVTKMVTTSFNGVQNEFDRDVVAVTDVTAGDKLQPMSAKIVASSSSSMMNSEKTIKLSDYNDVWAKLETLAPASATDEVRLGTIEIFLAGLNYRMVSRGGEIVSMADGHPISPSTLTCYLNGYIPDKPYIKTNCPAF